jgi:hypothetical protein
MNVGSDIIIGTRKDFSNYVSDGWLEGFVCDWSSYKDEVTNTPLNSSYYNNTLLNISNYGGPGIAMSTGNAPGSVQTYYGWKFVYKPYSSTKIQWAILYVVVREVSNGSGHFHNLANNYYLSVDGKDMITTTPYNDGSGNGVSAKNGAGTAKIDGRNLGALPSVSGSMSAGTTFCTFYGTFTPSGSSKFAVKYQYVNIDYIGNYPPGYSLTWQCQCYAKSPSNYASATTWTRAGAKAAVDNKTFLYTNNNVLLAPSNIVVRKSSATGTSVTNVSYKQSPVYVTTSDGKYVCLSGISNTLYSSGKSYNIGNISSFPSTSSPTTTLTAKASFWKDGNWFATKTVTVYFEPKPSSSWNGDNLKFKKFTPLDKSGYFNYLRISDGNGHTKNYTKDFTASDVIFNIVKDSQTGKIIINGESTNLGGID